MTEHQLDEKTRNACQEIVDLACAANAALKSMSGITETSMEETERYTFHDLTGDIYIIRKAIQTLYQLGLDLGQMKGDPLE